jgi:hypothetical protein
METRWVMCYLWSVLVNPTPGWQAWLSPPPPETALQIWRPDMGDMLPLVCFGEPHSGLDGLAVSSTCGGASNMSARWAMHYFWSVLVNPTPGWRPWLSPPPEVALQTWGLGRGCVTFGLFW